MGSREGFAQRGDDILETELLRHRLEDAFVAFGIGLAAFHIGIGLEAEAEFSVFFVADADVYILHQRFHDGLCFLLRPEFLTEVQVDRHRDAVTLCRFASQTGQLSRLVGDGGSDARPVEPVGAFHDGIEIEISGFGFGDGRMRTVVDDLAGTHGSSSLQIVDTHTVAATCDEISLHTIFAQSVHSRLPDFVFRQLGHKIRIVSIVGTADSHVRLTATIYYIKRIGLNETSVSRSGQSQHDFT